MREMVEILMQANGTWDEILKKYPMAKFDSATTKSIELLPRAVKDKIFNLIVQKKTVNVMGEFLKL